MYYNIAKFILSLIDLRNKKKICNYFLKENKGRIETLIDVGAHRGESIRFFNKYFSVHKIYAFEPRIDNFEILKKNTKNLNNIKIFNLALGDKKGYADFYNHYDSESSTIVKINQNSSYFKKKNLYLNFLNLKKGSTKNTTVEVDTLDNLLNLEKLEFIDLVKIDTEGYDFHVLKGLGKLITKVKFIYFEHHFHNMLVKDYKFCDIDNFLKSKNFKKVFKTKMFFRKTFEYIYKNNSLNK
tara:strand:- start:113 stop:832 length:720 start_codon:yes stop_codon:yes gene_type:complete